MGKRNELFTTALLGFDKEEVLLYLNELISVHEAEKKDYEQKLDAVKTQLAELVRTQAVSKRTVSAQISAPNTAYTQPDQLKAAFDNVSMENEQLKSTCIEQNARLLQMQEWCNNAENSLRAFQDESDRLNMDNEQLKSALMSGHENNMPASDDKLLIDAQLQAQQIIDDAKAESYRIIDDAQLRASSAMTVNSDKDEELSQREIAVQNLEMQANELFKQAIGYSNGIMCGGQYEDYSVLSPLVERRRQLENELQGLLYRINISQAFLEHTGNALAELYFQWDRVPYR
ncbi:MAG: hypothetical protein RRZ42_04815 [Oscillospiraceae bacterium]